MDQFLYGMPIIGLVFEFIGYLIAVLPRSSRRSRAGGRADRVRGLVRRHVRTVRRRQHRHRRDDARRRVRRLDGRRLPGRRSSAPTRRRFFGATPALVVALVLRGPGRSPRLARPRLVIDLGQGGPDHQRHDHQHRRVRDHRLPRPLSRRARPTEPASSPLDASGGVDRPAGVGWICRHVPRPGPARRSLCSSSSSHSRSHCSGPVGACEAGRSASTRARRRQSASTSSGCATGTSCSVASWPAWAGAYLSMEGTSVFQAGHDRRPWVHRPGRDDRRSMDAARSVRRGAALRLDRRRSASRS